ncbi:MAG: hypothetical protein IT372_01070 [Polyangiaceae bacterium]|nr:hypothetical protein [Polyangiaceae bacterium]
MSSLRSAARGLLAALALAGAAGAGCTLLAPFPDVAPDPSAGGCVPRSTRACYSGPDGTEGVGTCAGGVQTCADDGLGYGPCEGEVLPAFESCDTPADEDCDGRVECEGDHVHSEGFGDPGEQRGTAIAVGEDVVAMAGYASGDIDLGGGPLGELGSPGKPDAFLASFARDGSLRWAKRFGDTIARGVAVAPGGDLVLVGVASGPVDFGGGELAKGGGDDVVIARFDAAGPHLWSRSYGGGANQGATAVAVDPAGSVIITGVFWGDLAVGDAPDLELVSKGQSDGFVIKLDAMGEPIWARRFGDAGNHQAGTAVAVDGQSNVLLAGWFKGELDMDDLQSTGETDVFIAKLSPAGDVLWGRVAPSTNAGKALGLAADGAGNVVVTGSFRTSIKIGPDTHTTAGDKNIIVAKLDDNGTPIWSRSFGDDADQEATAVAVDPVGDVLLTGGFLGRIDSGAGVLTATGAADGFFAKLDPDGGTLWARSFGDSAEQGGAAVSADDLGNLWATGYFGGSVDFGGGLLQSRGASDAFLVELSP